MDLKHPRTTTIAHARRILDAAKAENRELTPSEQATVEADLERVKELDSQTKGQEPVRSVMNSGGGYYDDNPRSDRGPVLGLG